MSDFLCQNCGIENSIGADICRECGFEFTRSDEISEEIQPEEEMKEASKPDIPRWVKGLQPLGSEEKQEEITSPEREMGTGPLEGLDDVLGTLPESYGFHRPPTHGSGLKISDEERKDASLFSRIIRQGIPIKLYESREDDTDRDQFRWIISGILILSILLSAVFIPNLFSLPKARAGGSSVEEVLGKLHAGDQVLIVFDYYPEMAGEMDYLISGVLNNLIGKEISISILSSTLTGSVIGDVLVKQVANDISSEYLTSGNYRNLGYLPGGPVGILLIAEAPGIITGRQPLNQNKSGQGVSSDYELFIVVASNPDTARMWIEQVLRVDNDNKMLLLVSAQAEPILRSYIESHPDQIIGFEAGLLGSASFSGKDMKTTLISEQWSSFVVALITACLILVFGWIYTVLKSRRERKMKVDI